MPTSPAQRVNVSLDDRTYAIDIRPGSLTDVGQLGRDVFFQRHVIVITDSVVAPLYLQTACDAISKHATRVNSVTVPAGETSKCLKECQRIWQEMLQLEADRSSVVVALGGGVAGDLAGFVAAAFARGLKFVQIPTSLLAQVDSSVGGKVGINLPNAKNMVGAFWQPQHVMIDTDVLSTLDDRNFIAGIAEVIKYGLIMDRPFFEQLESSVDALLAKDAETLCRVIARCCECKAKVVEEDEREQSGRRAILNYGHTYGHAIEAVFGYGTYLHGEAIAIGMTCAARLAVMLGRVAPEFLERQTTLFQRFGLPVKCPADRHEELLASMKRDKKVSRGTLYLILPLELGNVESVAAPDDAMILRSLRD